MALEAELWRQKSAIKWIKEGDANTAFFHSVVRHRRSQNWISRIRDHNGGWIEDPETIKSSAVSFFADLFGPGDACVPLGPIAAHFPVIDKLDNDSLVAMSSLQEVKDVVFQLDTQSAAGPDGFGALFYQCCWEVISKDLLEAVEDFFLGAQLPRGITSTMVVLIPKREGASHWREFRPISLCNVTSKILSKILANRVNGLLPKVVSPLQSGFVPGRNIVNNVLLAQELVWDLGSER